MAAGLHARELKALAFLTSHPGATGATVARECGYHVKHGPRLLRRLKPEVERRRRKVEQLGPALRASVGPQLRVLQEGGDLRKVNPDRALVWWLDARANLHDMELGRWGEPLSAVKAERRLREERARFDQMTANTVECHRLHGRRIPGDLLEKDLLARGRARGEAPPQAAVSDATSEGAPALAGQDPLAALRPPERCPKCCLMPWAELVYGFVGDGRGVGITGTKTRCGCDGGEATIYATERARQLAFGHHARVLASTGGGNSPSPYAARSYPSFDPLDWESF